MPVQVQPWNEESRPSANENLAAHGQPPPDAFERNVSIPVRVVNGKIEGIARPFPKLSDCIGDLVVPAFAVVNADDLEWLTRSDVRLLFEKDTLLLCRVSGRQVPPGLVEKCRAEVVPNSASRGAFVEVVLLEPLYLRSQGTKRSKLDAAKCVVPALDNLAAESLNEAYRRISEVFEPKRRSFGGNVFRGCYYFDAEREQWRPIGELRGDVIFVAR
jgi:hypothetical protein